MIETRKAHLLDVVEVLEDLPEYDVKRGERGAIVEVFDDPEEAYMVEFVDPSGTSSRIVDWVRPDQIENLYTRARDLYLRGIELINAGKTLEGRRMIRQAVSLWPDLIEELLNSVLDIFGDSEDWDHLIPTLRFISQLNPNYEPARNNLVIAYLNLGVQQAKKGDAEGSLQLFYPAIGIKTSPEVLSWVKQNLIAAHTSLGIHAHSQAKMEDDPQAALKLFESALNNMYRACAVDPNERTRHNLGLANAFLGNALLKRHDLHTAAALFEVAEDMGLTLPKLYNNHAAAVAGLGEMDQAIELFERALELDPDYEKAKSNLIQVNLAKSEGKTESVWSTEDIDLPFTQLTATQPFPYQRAA